jgi:hypothetical protein
MERVELLLVQLQAAELLLQNLDHTQDELLDELRQAMREVTVCAYRLKLGRMAQSLNLG